jgi:uncharacterized protein (TIGR01777 family)
VNILLTGGTGLIGRALTARLAADGHQVATLTRDPDQAWRLAPMIRAAYRWPDLSAPPPAEALAEADAVVHLAGEPVRGRWTAAKKRRIRESRVLGTRSLVAGISAAAARPRALIAASATGYYGDRGEERLAESAAPGNDFLAEVCRAWESEARVAEALGVRVVSVRIGLVLDAAGGALRAMLPAFRWGLGGRLGSGRQWWPWISLPDLVRLLRFALEQDCAGALNGAAPEPVRQAEFARRLAGRLRRPLGLPAPEPLLRLFLGELAAQLLASARVEPLRARELGFEFEHPVLDDALAAILGR